MKNRYVLAADVPLIALAAFGAFALRFDWFAATYRAELIPFLAIVLVVKPVVFLAFGMYRHYWAYASVRDMLAVLLATSGASLAVAAGVTLGLLTGYFQGWRRGQQIGGYAVGGRPGRESAQGWDFSRDPGDHEYDEESPYRAAGGHRSR